MSLTPNKRPIDIVVGSPFEVPRMSHPPNNAVDETLANYCKAVEALYHEHKQAYGYEKVPFNLI